MKTTTRIFLWMTLVVFLSTLGLPGVTLAAPNAQGVDTSTPTATATATPTATATATPPATATATNVTELPPPPFGRPQMVIKSYGISGGGAIRAGQDFTIDIQLYNAGQRHAVNIQVTFPSGDLIPRDTGGVVVVGEVAPSNHYTLSQPMTAALTVSGPGLLTTEALVSYYDMQGNAYSEKFTLAIPLVAPSSGGGPAAPTRTPTPVSSNRPLLVIASYQTDTSPLQPGSTFNISMQLSNVGLQTARNVTMIVGGGSASVDVNGTPQPGGVSGGSGEFTNFAPIGSSNVQKVGDVAAGATMTVSQGLIVNVTTAPGAYPMKISFIYVDEKGGIFKDDQVITLLVYSLPSVDISFYRDPGMFFVGQPNAVPLQVVNLGRKTAVLGNMRVTSPDATFENAQVFVGALEPGGYFTLDAMSYPQTPGSLSLEVTIEYTDDFNQPRTITKTLTVEVMEQDMPPVDPNAGGGGGEYVPVEETFWQKAWRFILGLLGLDSAPPTQPTVPTEEAPPDGIPVPVPGPVIGPKG